MVCPQCQYDLRGIALEAPCPECGSTDREPPRKPSQRAPAMVLIGLALCFLTGCVFMVGNEWRRYEVSTYKNDAVAAQRCLKNMAIFAALGGLTVAGIIKIIRIVDAEGRK